MTASRLTLGKTDGLSVEQKVTAPPVLKSGFYFWKKLGLRFLAVTEGLKAVSVLFRCVALLELQQKLTFTMRYQTKTISGH
jgi:hypothetical protein